MPSTSAPVVNLAHLLRTTQPEEFDEPLLREALLDLCRRDKGRRLPVVRRPVRNAREERNKRNQKRIQGSVLNAPEFPSDLYENLWNTEAEFLNQHTESSSKIRTIYGAITRSFAEGDVLYSQGRIFLLLFLDQVELVQDTHYRPENQRSLAGSIEAVANDHGLELHQARKFASSASKLITLGEVFGLPAIFEIDGFSVEQWADKNLEPKHIHAAYSSLSPSDPRVAHKMKRLADMELNQVVLKAVLEGHRRCQSDPFCNTRLGQFLRKVGDKFGVGRSMAANFLTATPQTLVESRHITADVLGSTTHNAYTETTAGNAAAIVVNDRVFESADVVDNNETDTQLLDQFGAQRTLPFQETEFIPQSLFQGMEGSLGDISFQWLSQEDSYFNTILVNL